jgi:hypothetical protein
LLELEKQWNEMLKQFIAESIATGDLRQDLDIDHVQRYFGPGDTNVFTGPGTGVVLGEPGFDLGERGRRDRFGPRRGESLFPRESGYTKNSKAVTVVL